MSVHTQIQMNYSSDRTTHTSSSPPEPLFSLLPAPAMSLNRRHHHRSTGSSTTLATPITLSPQSTTTTNFRPPILSTSHSTSVNTTFNPPPFLPPTAILDLNLLPQTPMDLI
ncbi:hypothetical protein QVD17_20072 [Tagetes erecta]|uniref:Uncharacterized protein n=1 Tax=Tagetes erecta TaxID=13708 RepID=A0AAD8KL23_TARER|nr:hypothetical protein QVD17_20072 [Tagetes erecta]